MGKKQRDCAGCGAPVGIIGRDHCCLCMRKIREAAAKSPCAGCGRNLVLIADTGKCTLCSRRCQACGGPVRARTATLCRRCRRRAEAKAAKSPCPRCGRQGILREATGWCGNCSRPRPAKDPPRICTACGELRQHSGLGLCDRCWQKHSDRPFVRAENVIAGMTDPPPWFRDFASFLAVRHCPSRACSLISKAGRLLAGGSTHPQAILEAARRPGRSMGTLACALEDFFTDARLALPTDQAARLAAGRRRRRIDDAPMSLRPAVEDFSASMLRAQHRARRSGTRPRTDHTIETALAIMRDFALFLASHRGKADWALVDVHDAEAFLAAQPGMRKRRLTVLRQFFRHARTHRIVLIDPTRGLSARTARGITSPTLPLPRQRELFRQWTSDDEKAHPHETLLGMLALLHGASCSEVRLLTIDDIDSTAHTIRLGHRPGPVPLDPATWRALERCLAHRSATRTANPHVVVTRATKARRTPASSAYLSHLLDTCHVAPRSLRITRLADLVNALDPKLVAAAFGMRPEGVVYYLADHVDTDRLPAPNP